MSSPIAIPKMPLHWRGLGVIPSQANRSHLAYLLAINAVIVSQFLGQQALLVVYPALAAWALRGPREAIQALSLLWIPALLNPAIFPVPSALYPTGPGYYTALRWLVLLAAFGSVSLRVFLRQEPLPRILGLLILFVLAAVPGSLFVSPSSTISLLKLMSFGIGVATIVLAFQLSKPQHWILGIWFFDLALVVVAWNAGILPLDAGYRPRDELYQGLFYHPQVTGMVIAVVMAWLAGNAISRKSLEWQSWLLVAAGAVVLYETGSRTAAYSMVLALLVVIGLAFLSHLRWQAEIQNAMRRSGAAGMALLCVAALAVFSPAVFDIVKDFVVKREPTPLGQPVQTTRMYKIENQWEAFKANPVFGNGFGVPSTLDMHYPVNRYQGITLSAPTEKNFMPTAVLEEVGAVGAIVFAIFLLSLLAPVVQVGTIAAGWLGFTFILSNLGEISFFSFGGVGMFLWVMFGLARSNISHEDIDLSIPDALDGRRG